MAVVMAAAFGAGAATGMAPPASVQQSINESNRQMLPGSQAFYSYRRQRLPFTGGDNAPGRRRLVKSVRCGGIHKHFNKKRHGRALRRKHGRNAA